MPGPYTRSHSEIYLHLVWGTWDRHPLLTPDRIEPVYGAIERECKALGCEVIALGGTEDHVHLFVSAPPTVAPATLVKRVKGSSSHLVNPAHGTRAEFRWQRGYGVFSVSRQHVQRIRRYVLNQEEHHRTGRTAEFLEPVYPPLVPQHLSARLDLQSAKADFVPLKRRVSNPPELAGHRVPLPDTKPDA